MQPGGIMAYDVAVVGAGPAGGTAAITLAGAGLRVVILEKAALPRQKACGGGVVWRAVRLLPPDISHVFQQRCQSAELKIRDSGLSFVVRRKQPMVSMTIRADLDYHLALAARDRGARVLPECRVTGLILEGERVRLRTKRGDFWAHFVVAADGAMSTLAKEVGFGSPPLCVPALECTVTVPDRVYGRFHGKARFDLGGVPRGYSWVFPKKEFLSVGILSRRSPISLRKMLVKYLKELGIGIPEKFHPRGSFIPVTPRRGPFVLGRTILTGDAAGLADPVTCEGITHAALSGKLAARALLDCELNGGSAREAYESLLQRHILGELGWGRRLAGLIYGHPLVRNRLFRHYGQRMVEAMADVVTGAKTYHEIMTDPFTYINIPRVFKDKKLLKTKDYLN